MFRWFETRIEAFPAETPVRPPETLLAFYIHFIRPIWPAFAMLLVAGFAGSFVGGLLISLAMGDGLAIRPSGIIGSVVGAMIVLTVWRRLRPAGRRR